MTKTNALRLLDKAKINYTVKEYTVDESDLSGNHVATLTNMNPDCIFKTLITRGDKNGINIFCIPVNQELDLKKSAKISSNKKLEMVLMKDILSITGYIRGGCSPIGMKKKFKTFIHISAQNFDNIAISAGVRGAQVILNPYELCKFIDSSFNDITKDCL